MEALEILVNVNPIDQLPIAILNNDSDLCIEPMVQANALLAQPLQVAMAALLQYILPTQNGTADLMAMMAAMQH